MKDNVLMQIANALSANVQKLPDPGLLEGKMGVAVFLYHYARYSGRTAYNQLAGNLLDEILESMSDSEISFSTGLSGIGWGMKHLLDEHFCEAEDDMLEEIDNSMIHYITNHTDEDMLDGCLYLAVCRPESLDDALTPVIARQVTWFLSAGSHPLGVLNKLLVFAIRLPQLRLHPWFDKLPEAAIDAIDTPLYRRSDMMICRDLLETSDFSRENSIWNILHDRCTAMPITDDFQTDCLETVWQNLVFLGGKRKRECDIEWISKTVTDKLKDLSIQDMCFSAGLPAMGMDLLTVNG